MIALGVACRKNADIPTAAARTLCDKANRPEGVTKLPDECRPVLRAHAGGEARAEGVTDADHARRAVWRRPRPQSPRTATRARCRRPASGPRTSARTSRRRSSISSPSRPIRSRAWPSTSTGGSTTTRTGSRRTPSKRTPPCCCTRSDICCAITRRAGRPRRRRRAAVEHRRRLRDQRRPARRGLAAAGRSAVAGQVRDEGRRERRDLLPPAARGCLDRGRPAPPPPTEPRLNDCGSGAHGERRPWELPRRRRRVRAAWRASIA